MLGEVMGGESTSRGRARGDEPRTDVTKESKHRVDVLVSEDGGNDGVVVAVELLHQVTRTVGIVRAVPDLAVASLEAAGESDARRRGDRMADERLGRLARAADPDLAVRDEVRVRRVGKDDDGVGAARLRASPSRSPRACLPSTSVCSSPTFVRRTTRVRRTFVAS